LTSHPIGLICAGAVCVALIGAGAAVVHAPRLVARLDHAARAALDRSGGNSVRVSFTDRNGWLTRHPTLSGGDALDDATRIRAADAVAGIAGIGGVTWAPRARHAAGAPGGHEGASRHCQRTIEAILRARSIRFAEGSAAIDPDSRELLDEVAAALRPCTGSVIAISGHTDTGGGEAANLALSQARADAVRQALGQRGIPLAGLRARGMGDSVPLPGLDPADPANRRIEFAVIAPMVLVPTPVDTPGPG
jgi:OOP family OmpA-OmpF porin